MGNAQLANEPETEALGDELEAGTTLMLGQYRIESFLNAGGFGITYAARDSLDRRVVIKECFPGAFCRRSHAVVHARSRAHQSELRSIVRLFVQEARSLAKLNHPNIVGVHQVFEENDTAYMALDFVEGRDLLDIIEDSTAALDPQVVEKILRDILSAISFVHDQGLLHRDISPDNILLNSDNTPVLIDFGAAREQASKQSRALSQMRVVKDGYSPQEFYIAGSVQGAFSDLYALGATFYHLIAGTLPPDSQSRLAAIAAGEKDPYVPLLGQSAFYGKPFLAAIDKAMEILPKDRLHSAQEWLDMMDGKIQSTASPAEASDVSSTQVKARSGKGLLLATVAGLGLVGGGFFIASQPQTAPDAQGVATTVISADAPTASQSAAIAPVLPQDTPIAAAEQIQVAPASVDPSIWIAAHEAYAAAAYETQRPLWFDAAPRAPKPLSVLDEAPIPRSVPWTPDDLTAAATVVSDAPELAAVVPDTAPAAPPAIMPVAVPKAPVSLAVVSVPPSISSVIDTTPAAALPLAPTVVALPDTVSDIRPVARPAPTALERASDAGTQPTRLAGMHVAWTVKLPYDGFFETKDGETRIFAVNGITVRDRASFDAALRQSATPEPGDNLEISVALGVDAASTEEQTWTLPVVETIQLSNGFVFEAGKQDDAWTTRVIAVPDEFAGELQPGDVMVGYIPTSARFDTRSALPDLLVNKAQSGTAILSLAVARGDATWAVALPFDGAVPLAKY